MTDAWRADRHLLTQVRAEAAELATSCRPFGAVARLRRALRSVGPTASARLHREIDARERELARRPGRVFYPVELGGPPAGDSICAGIRRLEVHAGSPPCSESVGFERIDLLRASLALGAALAGEPDVELMATTWPGPPGGQVGGPSFSLAAAVGAWSRLTRQPVPSGVAFTGWFDAGGTLVAPPEASLDAKVAGLRAEWGSEARLITGPTLRDSTGLVPVTSLREALGACGLDATPPPASLRDLARRVEREAGERRYEQVVIAVRALIKEGVQLLGPDELFAAARDGARALNHLGRPDEALRLRRRASAWADRATPHDRAELDADMGISLIDNGRPAEACALLEQTTEAVLRDDRSDARLDHALTQLFGSWARAASACGDHPSAVALGERALARARPDQRARNTVDLARWHLRAGRPAMALELLARVRRELDRARRVDPETATATHAYERLCAARCGLAKGDAPAARRAVSALAGVPDLAIRLGRLEVHAALGDDVDAEIHALSRGATPASDGAVNITTRYLARIELRRSSPDRLAISRWIGRSADDLPALLAELERTIPY